MIHKLNRSFSDLHHPHSCLFSAKSTWWNSKWGKPTLGLQGPCTLHMELLWRWLITQTHRSHHHWSPQTLSASTTTPKLIVNAFASYLAGKKKNIYIYTHTHIHIYVCIYTCAHAQSLIHVWLFVTPWAIAWQAPLSMGFPRSGLPFPSPGDLLRWGIEPASSASAGRYFTAETPGKPTHIHTYINMCVWVCVS